jgi:L-ribulokinase
VRKAGDLGGLAPDRVVGIEVDTTGSTPLPEGVPLAFRDEFKDELAAQAWLWKDYTAHAEANTITRAAANSPYLA